MVRGIWDSKNSFLKDNSNDFKIVVRLFTLVCSTLSKRVLFNFKIIKYFLTF